MILVERAEKQRSLLIEAGVPAEDVLLVEVAILNNLAQGAFKLLLLAVLKTLGEVTGGLAAPATRGFRHSLRKGFLRLLLRLGKRKGFRFLSSLLWSVMTTPMSIRVHGEGTSQKVFFQAMGNTVQVTLPGPAGAFLGGILLALKQSGSVSSTRIGDWEEALKNGEDVEISGDGVTLQNIAKAAKVRSKMQGSSDETARILLAPNQAAVENALSRMGAGGKKTPSAPDEEEDALKVLWGTLE